MTDAREQDWDACAAQRIRLHMGRALVNELREGPDPAEVEALQGCPRVEAGEFPVVLLGGPQAPWTLLTSRRLIAATNARFGRTRVAACYLDHIASSHLRREKRKVDVRFVRVTSTDGKKFSAWAPDASHASALAQTLLMFTRGLREPTPPRPEHQPAETEARRNPSP